MAGDSFTLRIDGQDQVERALFGLLGKIDNLQPLMEIIGQILDTDVSDNFAGEHAPDGTPWAKSQRAKDTGGKTLQNSRRLLLSMGYKASPTSVEEGTNVIYGRAHNQGWSGTAQVASHQRVMDQVFGVKLAKPIKVTVKAHSRKGNTPRRQFLGLSAHAREDIFAAAEDYVGGEP